MKKYNLFYYVYVENHNKRKIEKYNVLNDTIIEEILNRTKDLKDKKSFSEEVDRIIMYYYWSRSEWETILADWPPRIDTSELSNLNAEMERHQKIFGKKPYSLTVNLVTAEKIDVYDQITMNWNLFIDYLWENLKGK